MDRKFIPKLIDFSNLVHNLAHISQSFFNCVFCFNRNILIFTAGGHVRTFDLLSQRHSQVNKANMAIFMCHCVFNFSSLFSEQFAFDPFSISLFLYSMSVFEGKTPEEARKEVSMLLVIEINYQHFLRFILYFLRF